MSSGNYKKSLQKVFYSLRVHPYIILVLKERGKNSEKKYKEMARGKEKLMNISWVTTLDQTPA